MNSPGSVLVTAALVLLAMAMPSPAQAQGDGRPPEAPARPSAETVARRAQVLCLLMYRGSLEELAGKEEYETCHGKLIPWAERLGLVAEMEKQEEAFLRTALGQADPQETLNATWRSEGLAVLAWALGLFELPPYDQPVDPRVVGEAVGFSEERLLRVDTGVAEPLIREAKLRPADEMERMARRMTIVNWRVRTYGMPAEVTRDSGIPDPQRMNFAEYLRKYPGFKEGWLEGLEFTDGDLRLGDTAIGDAPEEDVEMLGGIAVERQIAAYWLGGDHRVYSEVDPATILSTLK